MMRDNILTEWLNLKQKDNLMLLETQSEIFDYIQNYPGSHQREISRKLGIAYSTFYYHLNYLKRQGLIDERNDRKFKRYYVKDTVGRIDRDFLNIVRQKIPRNIIFLLCNFYTCSELELSKHLDKHPNTIKFHLKKLLEMKLIEPATVENGENDNKKPDGGPKIIRRSIKNEKLYRIVDRDLVDKLMIRYNKSFMNDKAYKVAYQLIRDFIDNNGHPKKIKPMYSIIDDVLDELFDIFPHPYHV